MAIVAKVKKTRTGQSLRPADIPNLGTLVRGLLPGDLDDMVDRPDDIDDLADVLGDHEDDLSSALVGLAESLRRALRVPRAYVDPNPSLSLSLSPTYILLHFNS